MTTESTAEGGELSAGYARRKRVRRALLVALGVLGAGIVLLLVIPKPGEKLPAGDAVAAASVRVERADVRDVPDEVSYAARVEADVRAVLSVERSGKVLSWGADEGDAVTNGQVLLRIDDRSAAVALRQAEANLRQVSSDVRRLTEMKDTGAVADSDLENAQTRLALAGAATEQARLDLEQCTLKSPLSGVVVDRLAEEGELVMPGQQVFIVASVDPIKAIVDLPERDVFIVAAGQTVPVRVDALADRVFTGLVSRVAAAGDAKSNTFQVEIRVPNPSGVLRPGVLGRVRLSRGVLSQAATIPILAVIPEKGQHIVYVVEAGHAIRRPVTISAVVDNRAVVSAGLSAGDQVVVEGQRLLADGAAVVIQGGGTGRRQGE